MTRLGRWLRYGLGLLLIAYALGMALLQVLWRTPALEIWWVQLLNLFGLWLYLPLLPALLLAWLARPRRAMILLLVPALCFAWEYGDRFVKPRVAASGTPLRVMTWNILHRNDNIDSIVATIRDQHPDVVALQELSARQAAALASLLGKVYPYAALYPEDPELRYGGMGVWSRFPVAEVEPPSGRRAGCSCQRLLIELPGGQKIRFVSVHTLTPEFSWMRGLKVAETQGIPLPRSFSTARQEATIETLAAERAQGAEPLVIVGDFNTGDRQPNYWLLRRYLDDAFLEAGTGFGLSFPNAGEWTHHVPIPLMLRIDYIFHSPGIVARSAATVDNPSSDHRGVAADLIIPPLAPGRTLGSGADQRSSK